MLKPTEEQYDVGVIVARFQVAELHKGHRDLLDTVCDRHDKVIVLLGLSPLMVTKENPLDFESRKRMLLDYQPDLIVLYVKDQFDDTVWSKKLDEMVTDVTSPGQTAVLYGSRDSFAPHYYGKFPVVELEQQVFISGTEVRKQIARSVRKSPDFRAGVIWAAYSKFPTVYTTVDVLIQDSKEKKVLLGRKQNEQLYRLIGGFADPRSKSFEEDAAREVQEETGLDIGNLQYLGSFQVDDWRYRKEEDCIKTLLFKGEYMYGRPKAADDIVEVRWFPIIDLMRDGAITYHIMPNHRPLIKKALGF